MVTHSRYIIKLFSNLVFVLFLGSTSVWATDTPTPTATSAPTATNTPITVPHLFTPGMLAKSSDMNENFQAHSTAINNILGKLPSKLIIKSNGVVVGSQLSVMPQFGAGSPWVITTKGVLFWEPYGFGGNAYTSAPWDGKIDYTANLYYITADCTGQSYVIEEVLAFDFKKFISLLDQNMFLIIDDSGNSYYTQPGTKVTITPQSFKSGGSCNATSLYPNSVAWPLSVNNPAVTGIELTPGGTGSHHAILPNITLELQ